MRDAEARRSAFIDNDRRLFLFKGKVNNLVQVECRTDSIDNSNELHKGEESATKKFKFGVPNHSELEPNHKMAARDGKPP